MVVALGLPMNGVRPAKTWLAVDSMSSTLTLPLFPAFYVSSLLDKPFPSILLDSLVLQNSNTSLLIKKIP
jgi:hypothetical protein